MFQSLCCAPLKSNRIAGKHRGNVIELPEGHLMTPGYWLPA